MELKDLLVLLADLEEQLTATSEESERNLAEGRLALFRDTEEQLGEIRGNLEKMVGMAKAGEARGMWKLSARDFDRFQGFVRSAGLLAEAEARADGCEPAPVRARTAAPPPAAGEGPAGCTWALEDVEGGGLRLVLALPGCASGADVDFEVLGERRVGVGGGALGGGDAAGDGAENGDGPQGHPLEIALPARVDPEGVRAKFSKKRQELTVHLAPAASPGPEAPVVLALPPGPGRARRAGQHMSASLRDHGYAVVDDFLPGDLASELLDQVEGMWVRGKLDPGEVAGGLKRGVRGDDMTYLSPSDCEGALMEHAGYVDRAVLEMMSSLEGLRGVRLMRDKAMLACYPGGGSQYVLHTDNPDGSNARVVTFVLYLNEGWAPHRGGALEVHARGRTVGVDPLFNRLACFWSDGRCPHAVTPAWAPRFAVSFWYYDSDVVRATEAGAGGGQ